MSKVIHVARGEAGDGNRLCPMANHGYVLIPICIYPASQTYEQREACCAGHCTTCWRGEDLDALVLAAPWGGRWGHRALYRYTPLFESLFNVTAFTKDLCQYLFSDTGAACTPESKAAPPNSLWGDHTHRPSFQPPSIQRPRALRRIREHLCSIRICVACPLARRVLNYKKSLRQLVRVSAECKTGRDQVYSV